MQLFGEQYFRNMLKFITSNKNKVSEAQGILGVSNIEQLDVDLPEIQSMDSHEIIKAKLETASAHHKGKFIVEDVSVGLTALNGFPGPLIKWFVKILAIEGVYKLISKYGDNSAEYKVIYGYYSPNEPIQYFEGMIMGKIVRPSGDNGFAWDPIFKPDGSDKTYANMLMEEKLQYSPRAIALEKLKKIL